MNIFKGEDIKLIILQREPLIMIDSFHYISDTEAESYFKVTDNNIFFIEGTLSEAGIVEHMAQSASAFEGFNYLQQSLSIPLGMIGEVRRLYIDYNHIIKDELKTKIQIVDKALGISLFNVSTSIQNQQVAECQMKIFVKKNV